MYRSRNTNPCTLLVLVGLKGAGKTFTGGVLETHLPVTFLRIEPIFLELMRQAPDLQGVALEQRGFQLVLDQLDALAQTHANLCIESTGAALTFTEFLAALRQGFQVRLIHLTAPLEICMERVQTRDARAHIPVSDQRLREINEKAAQVDLPWDLTIDNSQFLAPAAIADLVRPLLT